MAFNAKVTQAIIEWFVKYIWPELQKYLKAHITGLIVTAFAEMNKTVTRMIENLMEKVNNSRNMVRKRYEEAVRMDALAKTEEEIRKYKAEAEAWREVLEYYAVELEKQKTEMQEIKERLRNLSSKILTEADNSVNELAPDAFINDEKLKELPSPIDINSADGLEKTTV